MVTRAAQIILFAALLLPSSRAADTGKLPPAYRLGDKAIEDVVTPVPLMVVDREATEALRQQEMPRIPVIYRFNPKAADDAEASFVAAFVAARKQFLDSVETCFHKRELEAAAIFTQQFQELAAAFQNDNRVSPASSSLLALWAKGEPDDVVLAGLVAKLRAMMGQYIRPEGLPVNIRASARARIVSASPAEKLTLEQAEQQGVELARNNIFTLAKARTELAAGFPPDDQAVGKFLGGFLQENCLPDAELTKQSRAKRTENIVSADHYEAGQVLVRRGQSINVKTRAALEQLTEKLRPGQLQQQVAEGQTQTLLSGERIRGLFIALVAVVVISGFAIWRLTAMRRAAGGRSLLPMKVLGVEPDGMVISCPTCAEHIVVPLDGTESVEFANCNHTAHEHWKQRALEAERRAEKATALAKSGLMTQLAHYLSHDLVRRLIAQRDHLLHSHRHAAKKMEALEERVGNLGDAEWQTWRASYDKRIAELEKQLVESSEINRALIKTKIAIARRQMEATKAKMRWN